MQETARLRLQLEAALGSAYTLEQELGGGGMSRVFLASDARLGRRVVVKVLAPELGAGLSAQRFEREVRLAARLQHPHVVPLLAAGEVGGLPYYTMPYVEGESLRRRLSREGALPIPDTVRLLHELADALDYAHEQGVIHRDLKPENVLLSRGHAVVADFGIAKALAAATGGGAGREVATHAPSSQAISTGLGVAVGTPAYMAPEQVAADPATDHRADLYALGIVAYEMLTGAHPFAARAPSALLAAHLTEAPAPLTARRPDAPPALAALVMHLLAKSPDDRPSSAAVVRRTLDTLSRATDDRAARTRRAAARLTAAMLVLGLVVGAVWYRRAGAVPSSTRPASGIVATAAHRVLVVPFVNATGDSTLAPLGRMIAGSIEQGLASTGFLDVVPSVTELAVGTGEAGVRAASTAARAGTVVSGSYYLNGDSIRIEPQVTEVAGWRLVRGVVPVAALRARSQTLLEPVRQRVMAVLAAAHDPHFAGFESSGPPPTYAAAEEWVTGAEFAGRGNPRRALEHLTRAMALDTSWAFPVLIAADMHLLLREVAAADTLARRVEGRRATLASYDAGFLDRIRGIIDGNAVAALAGARATVEAAPGTPLPHFLLGICANAANHPREALAALSHPSLGPGPSPISRDWPTYWHLRTDALHMLGDHVGELAEAQTATQTFPESPDALADELRALAALGRVGEVRAQLAHLEDMPQGLRADDRPASSLLISLAEELDAHGHAEDAREALRRALAWQRARPVSERATSASRVDRVRALYLLGEYDAGLVEARKLAAEQPDNPAALAEPGLLAARLARRAEAVRIDARLLRFGRLYDRGETPYARARLAAQLGDIDTALTLLREALDTGVPYGPSVHADPAFAPLRADPRFVELLRAKG